MSETPAVHGRRPAAGVKYAVVSRMHEERVALEHGVRRLIEVLEAGTDLLAAGGECAPPVDVLETETGLELLMDLPGVPVGAIHVVFAENTLLVAGHKAPAACGHAEAAFHQAERSFGRFLRTIRLSGAWDAGAAEARLACGELRVTLPRLAERRGREIRIPVQTD
jgi:HSP20 family protein